MKRGCVNKTVVVTDMMPDKEYISDKRAGYYDKINTTKIKDCRIIWYSSL